MMLASGLKRIYLLRHGKSDWNTANEDHERPLAPRGRRDSALIGRLMADNEWAPDRILCSSATRTRQTIARVSTSAKWLDAMVEYRDDLYLASPDAVLNMIRSTDDNVSSLMVVGHQPFTSIVASSLLGGLMLEVPTACLVVVDCPGASWADAGVRPGRLVDHILPRTVS